MRGSVVVVVVVITLGKFVAVVKMNDGGSFGLSFVNRRLKGPGPQRRPTVKAQHETRDRDGDCSSMYSSVGHHRYLSGCSRYVL